LLHNYWGKNYHKSNLKRQIIITADGSTTIHLPEWNEQYHSKHGAIQEAYYVFIKQGLQHFLDQKEQRSHTKTSIDILEIGFGTGLNAFITMLEAGILNSSISYTGIEAYPVSIEEVHHLNYTEQLQVPEWHTFFSKLHTVSWEDDHQISDQFQLRKQQKLFHEIDDNNAFDIIYFDAFGARVQPELWTVAIFEIMFTALRKQGVLVTYAAKGSVRRAMQSVGFLIERLPGPPGKREMLRATKP